MKQQTSDATSQHIHHTYRTVPALYVFAPLPVHFRFAFRQSSYIRLHVCVCCWLHLLFRSENIPLSTFVLRPAGPNTIFSALTLALFSAHFGAVWPTKFNSFPGATVLTYLIYFGAFALFLDFTLVLGFWASKKLEPPALGHLRPRAEGSSKAYGLT